MPTGQKRAPDLITDGCEPPCGCWELNSGPLEEQAILLITEPSLQPEINLFKRRCQSGEMAPKFRAYSAHPDDLSSVPSTHTQCSSAPVTPALGV
ncbi:hypothetical protein ACRRTK_019383 [Alexandromys fortis]